jgi:pilus assembly protein CpaB
MLLAVANRPADNNTTFVTGGDVSRFQRRSIPAKSSDSSGNANGNSNASGGGSVASASVPAGPVVRVARGNNVTVVPVGVR